MKRVLFVCLGNICRSPALEIVLKKIAGDRVDAQSCGLSANTMGTTMDSRMAKSMQQKGYDTAHTPSQIVFEELPEYDYVFVATKAMKEGIPGDNIYLATHFSKKYKDQDIPDPYIFGSFNESVEMIEEIAESIADNI
ncbi:MAG: putative low molecular weight protein-tyrosine-phosphatase [Chlamydiia bacterium]|nr:putative low molecular weight protein-tyrosine-phosphatase [Chlamydiia bacterium]MCH9615558.1 putative low molecular weight protein-tyrosine-phosphatase [Chlamydiia bacterium]MCH9629213.1 putative low molecular weight protein-tyrosine-phosphatase [Chlamydiia bacterium]